ncbi:dynein light chain roadblock-type 1 [Empidonax traillii]|uniref:dynein light chain roadblock-type 1 n=1 Tax=Empidonax traillii TaxID=164674 RepID=UPI000FFD45FB|nr:dynein light chain roadblock-type 1 [Empidonax traillii]
MVPEQVILPDIPCCRPSHGALPWLTFPGVPTGWPNTVLAVAANPKDDFLCQAEVEETLKRIQSQKGVQGIIVVNSEGIPIKSTMDNSTTIQYAGLMHSFIMKARSTVRDIDPQNDLTFLRIRSKKNEIMVAPDKDYFLIVIQNPTE